MEKTKEVLLAILGWLKQNWLAVLLAIVVVVLALKAHQQAKAYDDLFTHLHDQTVDHEQEIQDLRNITQHQQEQQAALQEQFHTEINRIETEYQTSLNNIAAQRSARQIQIVHDAGQDPTTLTATTNQVFGIPLGN